MSLVDAVFLCMEQPERGLNVGAFVELETDVSAAAFQGAVSELAGKWPESVSRLGMVVRNGPNPLRRPMWAAAEAIDVASHVRSLRIDGAESLGLFVGEDMRQPLDRSRPLWQISIISGLAGGTIGVLVKVHHAVLDGVAGLGLASNLVPDGNFEFEFARTRTPPHDSSFDTRLVGTAVSELGLGQTPGDGAPGCLAAIRGVVRATPTALSAVLRVPSPRGGTPWRFGRVSLELERVRSVARNHGVTFNDFFLAAVGGGIRDHLVATGELPHRSLRAIVPLSLRSGLGRLGNATGSVIIDLRTDTDDRSERLKSIHDQMLGAKAARAALTPNEAAFTLFQPPYVAQKLMWRLAAEWSDRLSVAYAAIGTMRGPSEQLDAFGPIRALTPVAGPLPGVRLSISSISYADRLCIGVIATDSSDPRGVLSRIERALVEP